MQLGISTYTFTWAVGVPGSLPEKPMSVSDLVEKAQSFGINLVQVADNLPVEDMTEHGLKGLRDFARARNVNIEMGSRGLAPDHTMKCLKAAELLDSPLLRMVIDGKDFEPDLKSIISIIRNLEPEFRSRRIKLAIENHDRFKACEFEKIIQTAGSEWVGICLDSVNSMGAGEGFETVSDILMPYTINLHIKDFFVRRVDHRMGFVIEGRPAGQGFLDLEKLVSGLVKYGKCNSAILELWTPPESSLELTIRKENQWAEESIGYLKNIFK